MTIHSVGDQARAFVLQSQTARLRDVLQVLTTELSTGLVADRAGRLSGNTVQLHHFESQITILKEYKAAGSEAATFASAMQHVLEAVRSEVSGFGEAILSTSLALTPASVPLRAEEARGLFASAVGRLNSDVAGMHLFSGQATDTAPLAKANIILDELRALTVSMDTAGDIEAAITSWFDAPTGGGGYLDFAYSGTMGQPRLAQIAADRTVAFTTSAATPAIRDVLKSLAIVAVSDTGAIASNGAEQVRLVRPVGEALMSTNSALLDEMGRVGLLEALADRFSTEHSNALAVAEIGRSNLITADPFQTATALQEAQTQMQTLYALTARLSGLSLVEYLR